MNHPCILCRSIATLAASPTKKASLGKVFALGVGLSLAGISPSAWAQSNQTWNQLSADNTWNLTSTNWDAGVPWTQNNNAIFGGSGEAIVINADPIIFNDLTFSVSDYRIVGGAGSLVLGNDLASAITVTTGTASISETIANSANGASSLTKLGVGTLVLSGLNTYSGGTSIGAGTLSVSVLNNTGSAGHVGTGGTISIGSGATSGALTYTGTGETTDRVVNLAGDAGGATINQSGVSGNLRFTSAFTATGAGIKTLTLNGSAAGTGEIAGAIVNNSGANTTALAKNGTGLWTLSGNNTYSGATTLTGGVLSVTHANALGAVTAGTTQSGASELRISGGITLAAEAISINGGGIGNAGALRNFADNNTYTGTLTMAGQSRVVSDSGILTMNGGTALAGATNLITSGAGDINIAGAIAIGTGFIVKDALVGNGTGTLTFGGSNTYTGATTVGAGTLKLDYSLNDSSKLSDTAALILGTTTAGTPTGTVITGGKVELAGGAHLETVSSTTLTTNTPASTISRSSGSAALQMNLVAANTGTGLIFTSPGIATLDNATTNGILGFWARMNVGGVSTWATSDGFDDSPVRAFTGYTDINRLGGVVPNLETNHVRIVNGGASGNITLGGGALTQAYTLQMDAAAGGATIAPASNTDVLSVGDETGGAIWQTVNAGSLTIGSTAGNGVLTSGGFDSFTPATLRLINDSAANGLIVNSVIANNGGDTVSVTKSGAGTVVLNANNTFTGALTVAAGGTLILTGDNSARPNATASATVVSGVLQLQANAGNTFEGVSTALSNEQAGTLQPFILNAGGTLQLRSDSPVTFAGGNNFGGLGSASVTIDVNGLTGAGSKNTLTFAPGGYNVNTTTINVTGGNGNRLSTGTINNVAGGGVLTLNPTSAPLTLAGYTANATLSSTLQLSGTAAGNLVTGVVANPATSGATSVTKIGSSSWELAGADTYTGTTLVRQGILTLSGNRAGASGAITIADAAGLNGTLNIANGSFNTGATFVVSSQLNSGIVNQSGGSFTFTGGTQLIMGNNAPGSVGTYNLTGGTLTGAAVANRGVTLGTNTGTTGIFNLSGTGNLAMGLATVQVGRSDGAIATTPITNSTGILNQSGGTATVGTLTVGGGAGPLYSGTRGTLNLTGGTFVANAFPLFGAADNSSASITIGGTAQVSLPAFPTARGLNATTTITFDGGTLSPTAASAAYIGGLTNAFVTANGAKFDVANGRDITVSQALQNDAGQTGTVTKLGAGTLTLTGANTYSGATTVSAGSLIVNGSLAGGTVTVGSGAAFGGSATVAGAVNTANGSRILPGGSAIAGTLNVGAFTLVNGATVEYDLGGTNDLINVTNAGGLALNGGVFNLFNSGTLTPFATNGTYPLIDYVGTFTGSPGSINIGNAQAGKFYAVNNDATNTVITLTINDATVTEWNAGSGAWTTATNWTAGIPNAPGAVAKFGSIPVSPTTVTLNGPKTVGGIVFDNANTYTISGGAADSITLSNGIATAGITVSTGSHVITAPIVLATDTLVSTATGTALRLAGNVSGARALTAAGSGITILAGTNTYTTTAVTSGTLQVGDNGTTGTLGSGDVTLGNGAILVFNRSDSFTVANNIVGAAGQVTKLGAGTVTLAGTNTFALTGGSLNVNAGTVKVGNATALPSGVIIGFAGGTLDLNANDLTTSSLFGTTGTITDNGLSAGLTTLTFESANDSTFGGMIADGASRMIALVKRGAASLTLTGNNSFSGPVTIINGALIAAGPAGSVPISGDVTLGNGTNPVFLISGAPDPQFSPETVLTFANGTQNTKFQLRGTNVTLAGVDASPATTLSIIQNDEAGTPGYGAAPGLATLTLNTATDHSFTGLIRNQTGGGLNLVKTGLGTQEVRNIPAQGHNFNSATINQGKLVFNLNTLPGGGAGHNVLGANVSITVNAGGVLGLDGTWNMTRPVFGTGDVFKQGTGNVTISAASFHTGNTILSQGILTAATPGGGALPGNVIMGTGVQDDIFLVMGAENQFGRTSVIDFNNGPALDAKFELRGFNQTIAGLESDADDDLSIVQNQENGTPLPATLTINAATDHVFHGIIRTQAGGVLSLVKNGPGSQELRNVPATGYTFGPATINAGKLVFNFQSLPGGGAGHDTLGANIAITVNAGGALGLDGTWTMNAPVSGTGDLIKQGAETVTVSGFQVNHTGNTNVAAGTLLVTGSISGTAKVDVQSGATLGGNGSIAPATALTGDINLLAGGKLSPGVGGPGILSATLSGGGEFDLSLAVDSANSRALLFELDSNFNSDAVMLTGGALNIGSGKLAFDDFEFTPFAGFNLDTTYTLFDGALPIVGTLAAANLGGPIGPYFGTLALSDGGTDLVLVVTIPEPTAMAGLLGGLGFLLTRRRRAASK